MSRHRLAPARNRRRLERADPQDWLDNPPVEELVDVGLAARCALSSTAAGQDVPGQEGDDDDRRGDSDDGDRGCGYDHTAILVSLFTDGAMEGDDVRTPDQHPWGARPHRLERRCRYWREMACCRWFLERSA
jgi:hypothetical protein